MEMKSHPGEVIFSYEQSNTTVTLQLSVPQLNSLTDDLELRPQQSSGL